MSTLADKSPATSLSGPSVTTFGRPMSSLVHPPATPGRFSTRGIAVRLFLTCWIVYALHAATDVVREHYLAIAIAEDFSFRVDAYGGLHPDLFETPGRGWHIGNNPGASMVAAIPYAVVSPAINAVAETVRERRAASGLAQPPDFDTPRANARRFFAEAWRRGLDVKLGLAALAMQFLVMAPASALGVVLIFIALRHVVASDRQALWLALLYAFGTPVFFRTGFLNHNLMLAHIAFAGFLAMWDPGARWSERTRYLLGGLAAGATLLFDYSGVIAVGGLAVYGLAKVRQRTADWREVIRLGAVFTGAALLPVLLLWWYQWRSFGNFLLPGQHWMPPVRYIEEGYQGYDFPQLDLLWSLLFDPRYGLFMVAPLFILALAAPFARARRPSGPADHGSRAIGAGLPRLELFCVLGFATALWIFFGGNHYTRLQYNTGIRYLAPAFPFLFLALTPVLMRMRPRLVYFIGVLSVTGAWSLAMNREEWHPLGVLHPVVQVFTGGFELPVLTTLSRMPGQFGGFGTEVSPLPLFCFAAALIGGIWGTWSAQRGHQTPVE